MILTPMIPLETELPIPAFGFGILAFAIFCIVLLATLALGKGRPHS